MGAPGTAVDGSSWLAPSLLLLSLFLTALAASAPAPWVHYAQGLGPRGHLTYADILGAAAAVMATASALWLTTRWDGPWAWPLGGALAMSAWGGGNLLATVWGRAQGEEGAARKVWAALVHCLSRPLLPRGKGVTHLSEAISHLLGIIPSTAQAAMIRAVMELGTTAVREVMVPRIDIVAVDAEAHLQEVAETIVRRGYSRIPVYKDTIDNIIGMVHAREVLRLLVDGAGPVKVRDVARPAYFVPETKRVLELLTEMQKHRISVAIVVDEYGGTAGLVTLEDLLEEIVGEIVDEFDMEEEPVQRLSDDEALVDARVSIEVLEELFGVRLEGEEFETVGGFIYHRLGRMPVTGDQVEVDGLLLRVMSVTGRRIRRVRITRSKGPSQM